MNAGEKRGLKGRAARSNDVSRYDDWQREDYDDGWHPAEGGATGTELIPDKSRSIITTNRSPDVPFSRSINPYRGCEHGCIYCYARPSHAWLGYSPGLDFESRIVYKPDAAVLLSQVFARPSYRCEVIALGSNTDAYQPVERKLEITRGLLEVFIEHRHPLGIITKSALIERDIPLLAELARDSLVNVLVSVTTLDPHLSRVMEPRAASPRRRLQLIDKLGQAGIPVGVLVAPVIPGLTDHEMESILGAVKAAGAGFAGKVLLRLPQETQALFQEWLHENYPEKAGAVMGRIRDCRDGQLNNAQFGRRMTGSGAYAHMLQQRFRLMCQKLKLSPSAPTLDCRRFRRPDTPSRQLSLL